MGPRQRSIKLNREANHLYIINFFPFKHLHYLQFSHYIEIIEVKENSAGKSSAWVCPEIAWPLDASAREAKLQNLGGQLDLGFAFTGPLEIQVVRQPKEKKQKQDKPDAVQGAPPGAASVMKGCPPGQHVPAAVEVQPVPAEVKSGRGRGKGRGRGRGGGRVATPAGGLDPVGASAPLAAVQPPSVGEAGQAAVAAAGPPAGGSDAPKPKKRRIIVPAGISLGCSKCNHDEIGCTTCRPKAGLKKSSENPNKWIKADEP